MKLVLYLVFFVSGAAGLTYESVWARYLGLFVGHAAYAQVIVLGLFLGGMALGAHVVASRTRRIADPLLAYAVVEGVIGLVGLFWHEIFVGVTGVAFDVVFPALGGGASVTLVKWVLAAGLLLPQSVLLGATFPLMAAAVTRRVPGQPGRELATLYFLNALGAAGGVLVAGFVLLPLSGLPGSVLAASMANVLVAVTAWAVARRFHVPVSPVAEAPPAPSGPTPPVTRLLLAVSFGTALASFCYEIAWLRMLALVLGSATHSFELMLSAFILGLALGSLWVRGRADRLTRPLDVLAAVQWLMGFTALGTLFVYGLSFEWMATLVSTFAKTDAGYGGFTLARYGISLAVMLPSTFCAGITLPLITRALMVRGIGERAIGAVYALNTLGSIVGVALAALILMPLAGVRTVLLTGATLDMLLGVLLFAATRARVRNVRVSVLAAMATAIAVAVAVPLGKVSVEYLVSGVFRQGELTRPEPLEMLHYADGRTATVSVYREPMSGMLSITTNGKPDGSLHDSWTRECRAGETRRLQSDNATQILGPLITLAHSPDGRRAAVIGHGTGMSASALLADRQLEAVTSIEIEAEIVRGSRQFVPANRLVFDDPRSRIVIADAKTHFTVAREPYDVIFSEPSNPWVSGVASLFTVEFYEHVQRHLAPGGVLGQWIHMYELDDGLLLSVLAAIHDTFDNYALYTTNDVDLLIVASRAPLPAPDWDRVGRAFVNGGFLCATAPPRPVDLAALHLADRAVFGPLLDDWDAPNSDMYPILDLSAERARFFRGSATGFIMLRYEGFNIPASVSGRRLGPLPDHDGAVVGMHRLVLLEAAAAIRAGVTSGDTSVRGGEIALVLERHRRWSVELGASAAGVDWAFWMDRFRQADEDRHGGMDGVLDDEFYAAVYRFLDRAAPPPDVRTAVDFHRGVASWDFPAVSRTADALLATEAPTLWVTPTLLVEAGVTAKLLTNDAAGARRLYDAMRGRYARPPGHLRRRLLESYLALAQ